MPIQVIAFEVVSIVVLLLAIVLTFVELCKTGQDLPEFDDA